ncbi:MAG: hypothetical protein Q9162_002740 [Coniocarpon cinnabarinum]
MTETLPHIHITDPQLSTSSPFDVSQTNASEFADAVEYQDTPSRPVTSNASLATTTGPDPAGPPAPANTTLGEDTLKLKTSARPISAGSVDPVSQEIFERTGNLPPATTPSRVQRQSESWSQTLNPLSGDAASPRPSTESARFDPSKVRDKKKGVAFLARIIGNKKKDEQDESALDMAEGGEERPEGADVEMFYQSFDNMGFAPKHRKPPPYIKMRSKYKKEREFNRMFLAQQLRDFGTSFHVDKESINSSQAIYRRSSGNGKAVWALEVSKDGRFLASAGQDHLIRIWPILSSSQDRTQFSKDEDAHMSDGKSHHLSAPVFKDQPLRTFTGHTGDVLSLSWSKNNFLLSSSIDKTVRLWHVSRCECLCAFKHGDFVTSVAFHPSDDRFFLAGSLDAKLRLWSIPDKAVAYWNQAPEMITSVAFSPDGKQAMAGTLSGLCLFYETESLRYQAQLHVKSRTGKNAKGSKITGIKAMHITPAGVNRSSSSIHKLTDIKVLITSNDSRIRMYNLRDKSLEMKFKGHENLSSQIHACFSDDGRYVISGSEDKKVYIWSTSTSDATEVSNARKDHWPLEVFEAHSANSTCAIFLPQRSRQHLSASEDPIYDICNPPPVTLVSRSEAADVAFSPVRHSIAIDNPSISESEPSVRPSLDSSRRPSEASNNGYLSRTAHSDGNVLIAASASGAISVFRQDCAWKNRARHHADSEISSIKRAGSSIIHRSSMSIARNGGLSRQNSSTSNRSSIGPSSLRQSSYGSIHGPPATSVHGRESIAHWRQSVSGTSLHSLDRNGEKASPILSVADSSASSPALPQMRAGTRSTSPLKSFNFAKRASALVPGTRHSPLPDRSPTRSSALAQIDGVKNKSSDSSIQMTPTDDKTPSNSLLRPGEVTRGDSYWRDDAFFDAARQQLSTAPRSLEHSSDTSRSVSRSRSPVRSGLASLRRPGGDRRGGSKDARKVEGLPELEKKLTAFSQLSDAEE